MCRNYPNHYRPLKAMHIAFLEASKAFDRLNLCNEWRNIFCVWLATNLFDNVYIRWGNSYSDCSTSSNAVKPGVFSLRFFVMSIWIISAQSWMRNISVVVSVTSLWIICYALTILHSLQWVAKYILRLISYEFISQRIYTVGEFLLGLFYL